MSGTSARPPPISAARTPQAPEPTGWVGFIEFAGVLMVLLGLFHALQGLVALFQNDYFLVGTSRLLVHTNYTAWGWTHLLIGALIVVTGGSLVVGRLWARVVGVVLAVGSALVNAAFLAAYPFWSAIMIAMDVLVIWAVTVHGREVRAQDQRNAR
jgi:hypothetical protein